MPSATVKYLVNRKSLLVPLLSGLLLAASVGLLDRTEGLMQQKVNTFMTAGFKKYSVDLGRYQKNGVSTAVTVFPDGTTAADTSASFLKRPDWAGYFSLLLSLLVWLSLSALFILRPSRVLAGTLVWIGGLLTASILMLFLQGTLISPAGPLLAAVLLYFFLSLLGQGIDFWDRLLRQQRLDGFQQKMLASLADVVETRDPDAAGHIPRMQNYVRILCERLVRSGLYVEQLTPEYCGLLFQLTPLHDLGKAGIREEILLKPGRLTDLEFAEMKRHIEYGEAILPAIEQRDDAREFLDLAREIVTCHHEKWDGSGYPKGLAGEEIPLAGRILAVADVYDALISKRCYKAAYSHEQSRAILMKGRGSWFDPAIADAFREVEGEMWRISQKHQEGERTRSISYRSLAKRALQQSRLQSDGARAQTSRARQGSSFQTCTSTVR